MTDLKSPNWIIFKGLLFLLLGILAAGFLIFLTARWDVLILLLISIWAFCRFYYFAFYAIQNYVDSDYKFDGLYSVVIYLIQRAKKRTEDKHEGW